MVGPFLRGRKGRPLRWVLGVGVLLLIAGSVSLAYFQLVVLKMLPFDNKSEFQVIVDMPEGTTLEQTARVLGELGRYLTTVEEVTDYQVYAGTAAPINFIGRAAVLSARRGQRRRHSGQPLDKNTASARATTSPWRFPARIHQIH